MSKPIANKTLDLPLCGKWYDLFESSEKEEEYREFTEWIFSRILPPHSEELSPGRNTFMDAIYREDYDKANALLQQWKSDGLLPTHLRLRYGYTKRTMLFSLLDIRIGIGKKAWGAPPHEVLILKTGEKIE